MRIIDADALRTAIYHEAFENDASYDEKNPLAKWDGGLWVRYKMFERCLESATSIDAVQVIRCRDCKYRDADDFCTGRGYPNMLVSDDGFCDKGERRGRWTWLKDRRRWIPVSERMPETDDVYLVTVHPDYVPQGCKQVDLMYYFKGEWQFLNEKTEWEKWPDPIIAWMPLPEPYKVETEE